MGSFGREIKDTTGRPIQVTADGRPEWKAGGITVDWSTIDALSADETLPDGTVVKAGDKVLPYGTILAEISLGEVQTIDLSGDADPTGGTFTITYDGQTTAAIAYDASAQAVQDALEALSNVDPGDIVVSKSTFVYTLTFRKTLGNVSAVTVDDSSLTSGGSITVSIATSTAGSYSGKYGPADTTASDGRQSLSRGATFILDETVIYSEPHSDHPAVFEGGRVWEERLQVGKTRDGYTQPALSDLLTAMPRLQLVRESN
ncbi:MAG: hypothetical protein ACF8OB_03015 [Phycisphaeraceae bacterium JB051]